MQNDKEFLMRMHQRAAEIEAQAVRRRIRFVQILSASAGIAAVIAIALMMPDTGIGTDMQAISMQASIFSDNRSLGYIVTGLLAFMLGVGVTLLCYKLKQYNQNKENKNDRDD